MMRLLPATEQLLLSLLDGLDAADPHLPEVRVTEGNAPAEALASAWDKEQQPLRPASKAP